MNTSFINLLSTITNKDFKVKYFNFLGHFLFFQNIYQLIQSLGISSNSLVLVGKGIIDGDGSVNMVKNKFWYLFYRGFIRFEGIRIILIPFSQNEFVLRFTHYLKLDKPVDDLLFTKNDQFIYFGYYKNKQIVGRYSSITHTIERYKEQFNIINYIHTEERFNEFSSLVPKVLGCLNTELDTNLIQLFRDGKLIKMSHKSEEEIYSLMLIAIRPLTVLYDLAKNLEAPQTLLISCDSVVATLPQYKTELEKPYLLLKNWLMTHPVKVSLFHGDYWLGNVIFDNDFLEVKGIIDWDRSETDGLIMVDALHLYIASVSIHKNCYFSETIIELLLNQNDLALRYKETLKDQFSCHDLDIYYSLIYIWFKYLKLGIDEQHQEKWFEKMIPTVSNIIKQKSNN